MPLAGCITAVRTLPLSSQSAYIMQQRNVWNWVPTCWTQSLADKVLGSNSTRLLCLWLRGSDISSGLDGTLGGMGYTLKAKAVSRCSASCKLPSFVKPEQHQ